MVCYSPLTGYYSNVVGASGKRAITFTRDRSFSGVPIRLPCGQCIGCRLEKSRQWAMRCMHEKKLHKENCFVTLTYSNEFLPPGGTLVKRDLQLFMKRLRKEKGAGVRFYACGEYGELNGRPHYHCLLFNCEFSDKLVFSRNKRGELYYTSKALESLWPFGHCVIGDVSFDSAAYVARYVMKKVTGDKSVEHYAVIDGDGVVYDRLPEFTVMSRRPGIGSGWYKKFGAETYALDSVVVNGKEVRPPRFYDTKFELTNGEDFAKLKRQRLRRARLFRADNTPERRRVREVVQLKRLKQLQRSL